MFIIRKKGKIVKLFIKLIKGFEFICIMGRY